MSAQATPDPRRGKPGLLLVAALLLTAPPAAAQLTQYVAPGQLETRELPTREELRDRIARARWRAGSWRIQPHLSIGDVQYTNNLFDEADAAERTDDLRAGASAGLDLYLPLGGDGVASVFVRPSYTWWKETEDLRRFNTNVGVALFGFFNRLSTRLTARRTESERPLNNELRVPTTIRNDQLALHTRVTVRGPWQIFASLSAAETGYPNASALEERAPNLTFLARDEEVASAGVAYDIPGRFNLGVGWRRTDTEFVDDPEGRSSTGEYPFLSVTIPGNKLVVNGEIGRRVFEFDNPAGLTETEATLGNLSAVLELGNRTDFGVYGGRYVVYSGVDIGGYFTSERSGAALGWGDRDSLRVRFFAQTGSDEFASSGGANLGRIDDAEAYGVQIELPLRWGLSLQLGALETQVDSNFDEFDRSYTAVQSTVRLAVADFPF